MTEAEWLCCADPLPMLDHLRRPALLRDAPGGRELLLLGAAFARTAWGSLLPWDQRWIEAAEAKVEAGAFRPEGTPLQVARLEAGLTLELFGPDLAPQMAALVRCVVGDPFRPAPGDRAAPGEYVCERCSRCWRKPDACPVRCPACQSDLCRKRRERDLWVTPHARAIAQAVYDRRDWSALPVLADALEEGGCRDEGVLAHLRGPGPHCRGCHALELALGRG